jgi:hypothetical protein
MMWNDYRTSEEGVILDRAMTVPIEYVNVQQLWDEKEEARRADVEALRSGEKTEAQLQRENAIFALPPDRIRINLDSARALSPESRRVVSGTWTSRRRHLTPRRCRSALLRPNGCASRSVPPRSSRPIRTSWEPHAGLQVLSPGDITEVSGPPGLPARSVAQSSRARVQTYATPLNAKGANGLDANP